MNSWKVILATVVIFGCGLFSGLLLSVGARSAPTHAAERTSLSPKNSSGQRLEFLRKATRHLDLTLEQQEHVEKILKNSQDRTKAIWEQVAPQMREEMHKVKDEIRAELTPEQQKKFESLLKPHGGRKSEDSGAEKKERRNNLPAEAPVSNPATNN